LDEKYGEDGWKKQGFAVFAFGLIQGIGGYMSGLAIAERVTTIL